jgi:hypothetical protein
VDGACSSHTDTVEVEMAFTDVQLEAGSERAPPSHPSRVVTGDSLGLNVLNLGGCRKLTDVGVGTLSGLTTLTSLHLGACRQVTDVGVSRLSGLTALSTLYLSSCPNVTAAGKHALRTASPNLKIID